MAADDLEDNNVITTINVTIILHVSDAYTALRATYIPV